MSDSGKDLAAADSAADTPAGKTHAPASAAQLMGHIHDLARSGTADWVSDGNPAAPEVGPVAGQLRDIVERRSENRRKCLVDLEEVDISDGQVCSVEQRRNHLECPLTHVLACHPDIVKGGDFGELLKTEIGGALLAREQDRGRTVVDA